MTEEVENRDATDRLMKQINDNCRKLVEKINGDSSIEPVTMKCEISVEKNENVQDIEKYQADILIKKIDEKSRIDASKVEWVTDDDRNEIYQKIEESLRSA